MLAPKTVRTNNTSEWEVRQERDAQYARLHNYANGNRVEMMWDMNQKTKDDQIFILKIDGKEAWISAEELRRFLRWV